MILLILAIAWAAALFPSWNRNRSEARAADSIVSFRQHLTTLQRATPSGRRALHSAQLARSGHQAHRAHRARVAAVRRRRRDVLFTLAGATALTLLMAVVWQGVAVVLFVASAGLLGLYVSLLVRLRKRTLERAKVEFLVTRRAQPEPVLLLRRSASN